MQKFCENCGNQLSEGMNYCESCGSPISQPGKSLGFNDAIWELATLAAGDWEKSFMSVMREKRPHTVGILYTCEERLAGNNGITPEDWHRVLSSYMNGLLDSGIFYIYVNGSDNVLQKVFSDDVEPHISLLKTAADRMKILGGAPQNLFLIGGHDVVPQWSAPNGTFDSDNAVESDLAYERLSTEYPIDGLAGDLVQRKYPVFRQAQPEIYRSQSGSYQALYNLEDRYFRRTLKIYFNCSGGILNEYISKN